MPRSKATSAISRHLWNDHGRTRSEGTKTERMLLHEEMHAAQDWDHEHMEDGTYIAKCPACGREHACNALSDTGE